MNKNIWKKIELGIGCIILGVLIYKIGIKNIYGALQTANIPSLLIALVLLSVVHILGGTNVALFLQPLDKKIKRSQILHSYIQSWVLGQVLPFRVSSLSLILLLKKTQVQMKDAIAAVFMDKSLTFIVLFTLTLGSILMVLHVSEAILYISILSVMILIFFSLIRFKGLRDILGKVSIWKKRFEESSNAIENLSKRPRLIIVNTAITLLKLMLTAVIPYVILKGFGVEANIIQFMFISFIITTVASLPITASGLGVREVSAVVLYNSLMGIDKVIISTTYLLFLFLKYVFAMGYTIVHLVLLKKKEKHIKEE